MTAAMSTMAVVKPTQQQIKPAYHKAARLVLTQALVQDAQTLVAIYDRVDWNQVNQTQCDAVHLDFQSAEAVQAANRIWLEMVETWLDWETSKLGEPRDELLARMQNGGESAYDNFPWTLHTRDNRGEAQETNRNRGSVQKDWAVFNSFDFPEEFAIAVRSHKGWNHLDGAGTARYCLVVSFEVLQGEVPIYALIENEIQVPEAETRISVPT